MGGKLQNVTIGMSFALVVLAFLNGNGWETPRHSLPPKAIDAHSWLLQIHLAVTPS